MENQGEDITQLLHDLSSSLGKGKYKSVKKFKLNDCICAVELMDPKLDSGMKLLETKNSNQMIQENLLKPLDQIDLSELKQILDQF